jgi:PHD/YefM family antitoxin component YafN of YafNO toxin-antitoxin module
MKTVTISKRAKRINELLKRARRQNLIIRSPDGHEFILAEVDDFNREIVLTRENRRLMELLDRRARQTKTVPLNEAKARLGID